MQDLTPMFLGERGRVTVHRDGAKLLESLGQTHNRPYHVSVFTRRYGPPGERLRGRFTAESAEHAEKKMLPIHKNTEEHLQESLH
jgi:hypothetical protein